MNKIIAILRGVQTHEVQAVGEALVQEGITNIEVTLNSRDPLESIRILARSLGNEANIGAGTVTRVEEVGEAQAAGAQYVVSPNCNAAVIRETKRCGMGSYPGVFTATDCFEAIENGADALKLYPAERVGFEGYNALKAVLPTDCQVLAVGGLKIDDLPCWIEAGIDGFGLGGLLYNPGMSASDVRQAARHVLQSCENAA